VGVSATAKLKTRYSTWLAHFRLNPGVKFLMVALVIIAFVLQALRVFDSAYPLMSRGVYDNSNISLDFGAYYTSALSLVHNPSQLYGNSTQGLPQGLANPGFKYLPFFSFLMLPLLPLGYISALFAWNVFQFLLMPVIGLLLYKALKNVNVIVIIGVIWIALLQPIPFPPHYTLSFYDLYTSQSFYWRWGEGNAKVFAAFLIVATYYLSKSRRPYLAGLAYGLAFFDPRFPLYALPLFLMVNWGQHKEFAAATVATLVAGDVILLYDGLAGSFLNMVETSGIGTIPYQYFYIPFYTIVALTVVEGIIHIHQAWSQRSKSMSAQTPPLLAPGP